MLPLKTQQLTYNFNFNSNFILVNFATHFLAVFYHFAEKFCIMSIMI